MSVQPADVIDAVTILMVPVMIVRLVVGASHRRRTHLIWTFGLPTLAVMLFFLRVSITRKLDLFGPDDWLTAVSYLIVLISQAIATIYQWAPPELFDRPSGRENS